MKKRIFVEKRGIFDVESPKIFSEIKTIVPHIQDVKVYNIYDLFGIEENELNKVIFNTFVDPVVDILHTENPAENLHFATEFLPGQYDQRADSAQQCIALLTENENSKVRSGKLIELFGVTENEVEKIKNHLINKVESQEKDLSKLEFRLKKLQIRLLFMRVLLIFLQTNLRIFIINMVLLWDLMIWSLFRIILNLKIETLPKLSSKSSILIGATIADIRLSKQH